MRNTAIVLALVAAGAMAAAPAFAQDATGSGANSGFYVNGSIGHSYFGSGVNSGND